MRISDILTFISIFVYVLCKDTQDDNPVTNDEKEGKFLPFPEPESPPRPSNDECVRRIYRDCNHPTVFTDEELENVRRYLNHSFTVLADIKPDKPLCPKLHVRQDWKCLRPQQKDRVINVWKVMYERGIVQSFTDLHVKTWPAWHKSGEFLPSHRWFTTEFEKHMRLIDPKVTLPYWLPFGYGTQPERSSVWDTFGHSGNYSCGYSVHDGIYGEWGLVPTIKRHWSPRGTIYPWFTPEFPTYMIQSSNSYFELIANALGIHFPAHLLIGGYEGQYSVTNAPYDVLFHIHHASNVGVEFLKWQLQNPRFLTPLSYNGIGTWHFNPINSNLQPSNLFTDTLTGVPGVTIRETFWIGFGDYCSIPDQLVRPINNIMKGIRDPIPTAAKRLPQWILAKYYQKFYHGNFTPFFHMFEEVGECNTRCNPIPKPTFTQETEQGRRQLEAYRFDNGLDIGAAFELAEQRYYQMWLDLNKADYCSPYVTYY